MSMLSRLYDKVRRYLYPFILLIGLSFCICWSVSPLRDVLIKWRWIDERTVFGVLGAMITITIFELQQHEKTSKGLSEALSQFSPTQTSTIVSGGVGAVYDKFNPAVKQMISESKQNTRIDVLGLTLFSAWPIALEPHIESRTIRNCTVNIYLLHPDFIEKHQALFKDEWLGQVKAKQKEITEFKERHEAELRGNQVTLNVKTYSFFPGVHGFRTSDGHLMISFVQWSKDQKTVDNPNQFYELFAPSDISARANAYRSLFENWLDRADRDQSKL